VVDGALAVGANAVVGIETRIMPFKGVHEMVMMGTASKHVGTAVKRVQDLQTVTDTLPPQAIIQDKDTWVNDDNSLFSIARTPATAGGGGGGN